MVSICLYFQVHQPRRLARYKIFDVGKNHDYFDEQKNKAILQKVAHKCYLPANRLMLKLLKKHPEFKLTFSFSGIILEQFEEVPEILTSFQELTDTGRVELLAETYYHSLASLFSPEEFEEQIRLHRIKIEQLFNQRPTVLRNTELVYDNGIAQHAADMGYNGILAEGWDPILAGRSPNHIYNAATTKQLRVLLKNYRLSDDIAFRFSDKGWKDYPLTASKYVQWINAQADSQVINLFMDYETVGEHQWAESGIFEFMEKLPGEILSSPQADFTTPSEAIIRYLPPDQLDVPLTTSWADTERDTSAWTGNNMQQAALAQLYKLEHKIKQENDQKLLDDWRKLQTSDHFYYMCTKWFNDGDVHKYFNPYDTPYDCFIAMMNIINDIKRRVKTHATIQV